METHLSSNSEVEKSSSPSVASGQVDRRPERNLSTMSQVLEPDTAQALKAFVKKNKPKDPNKFMSSPQASRANKDMLDPSPVAAHILGYGSEGTGKKRLSVQSASAAEEKQKEVEIEAEKALSEKKLVKFDIFDHVDEDRIMEFETLAKESRAQSNYHEHKQKTKKIDPNKFVSVAKLQDVHPSLAQGEFPYQFCSRGIPLLLSPTSAQEEFDSSHVLEGPSN